MRNHGCLRERKRRIRTAAGEGAVFFSVVTQLPAWKRRPQRIQDREEVDDFGEWW